jgi:hypothetical protein
MLPLLLQQAQVWSIPDTQSAADGMPSYTSTHHLRRSDYQA